MKTLLQLREEKENLSSLQELTDALKYLSAAKMGKIRKKVLDNRHFLEEALKTRTELQKYTVIMEKKKKKKKKKDEEETRALPKNDKVLVVAVSSNQGLCGRFNVQLANKIIEDFPEAEPDLLVLGTRGKSFFNKSKFKTKLKTIALPDNVSMQDMKKIFDIIISYGTVYVYYNKYITAVRNIPVRSTFASTGDKEGNKDITKENEKEEESREGEELDSDQISRTYIVEPNFDDVQNYFESVLAEAVFMQQTLESRLSENNNRMLSMKEANDNVIDLLDQQKKEYNRIRRAKINQALTEVSAGRALW